MNQFEVGKVYIAHDSEDWNKTLEFTVLHRNEKTLRIQTQDGVSTVPYCENAFGEGGELCVLRGFRLVSSSQVKEE